MLPKSDKAKGKEEEVEVFSEEEEEPVVTWVSDSGNTGSWADYPVEGEKWDESDSKLKASLPTYLRRGIDAVSKGPPPGFEREETWPSDEEDILSDNDDEIRPWTTYYQTDYTIDVSDESDEDSEDELGDLMKNMNDFDSVSDEIVSPQRTAAERAEMLLVESIRQLLRQESLNLWDIGSYNFPYPSAATFVTMRRIMEAWAIEMYMRRRFPNEHLFKMDFDIRDEKKTPDFIIGSKVLYPSGDIYVPEFKKGEGLPETWQGNAIEFKNRFKSTPLIPAEEQRMVEEVREHYGRPDMIVIILTWNKDGVLDKMTSDRSGVGQRMWELYRKWAGRVEGVFDGDKISRSEMTSEDFLKFMEPQLKEHSTEHIADRVPYKEFDEIMLDFLGEIHRSERFLNANHLATEDMVSRYPSMDEQRPTVYLWHPWNRDKNRERFKSLYGLEKQGMKASYIMSFPSFWDHEIVTPGDFDKLISRHSGTEEAIIWEEISISVKASKICAKEEIEIQENVRKKAFYGHNADEVSRKEFATKRGIDSSSEGLVKFFDKENKVLLKSANDKIKKELGYNARVRISPHGRMVISGGSYITYKGKVNTAKRGGVRLREDEKISGKPGFIDKGKATYKKKSPYLDLPEQVTSLEMGDYIKLIQDELDSIEVDKVSFEILDMSDMIPHQEWRNSLSNELEERADEAISAVTTGNPYFSIFHRYQKAQRTLMATVPRQATKGSRGTETTYIIDPHCGVQMIATPAPNGNTGGPVIYFGKVHRSKWRDDLTLDWVGPLKITRMGDYVYYHTKPIRENWEALGSHQQHYWGFISVFASCYLIDQRIDKDFLFWSLGLKFTIGNKQALDLLYLLDKSTYLKFTFGKFEISKKLPELFMSPVAMTILYRTIMGHSDYSKLAYESTKLTKGQMRGLKHYLSEDIVTTGWYGSGMLTYLKQILTKAAGQDKVSKLGKYWIRNADQEQTYDESPFCDEISGWKTKSQSMKEFFDKLLPSDKSPEYWEPYAWNQDAAYAVTRKQIEDLQASGVPFPTNFRTDMWDKQMTSTGKNTKTLLPKAIVDHNIKKPEKKESKGMSIPGLSSLPTNDALITNIEFHRSGLVRRDLKSMEGDGGYYWMDLPPNEVLNPFTRGFTMLEGVLLDLATYKKFTLLATHYKYQTDADGRAFYQQDLKSRNGNILFDYVARDILNHPNIVADVILAPGNAKFIKMQQRSKEIGNQVGDMSTQGDMAKFGDLYSVAIMYVLAKVFLDLGVITEPEFSFMWYLLDVLKRRLIMMPISQYKSLKEIIGETDYEKIPLRIKKKVYLMEIQDKFLKYTNKSRVADYLSSDRLFTDILDYVMICRQSGGTLGVFNVTWSTFSVDIAVMVQELIRLVFLNPDHITRIDSHSDDTRSRTRLEVPPNEAFQGMYIEEMLNHILVRKDGKVVGIKGRIFRKNNRIYISKYSNKTKEKDTGLPWWVASKFYISLIMFVPRLFSQRPSLLKCGVGTASEMLQVVNVSGGNIYVPWIRSLAAIGAETSGKSPTQDTLDGVGKVYEALTNGCPATVAFMTLKLVNMMISDKFGLERTSKHKYMPLQMGGIWYAPADVILMYGFRANEGRLISYYESGLPDSCTYKRMSQIMIHTKLIWRGKVNNKRPDENKEDSDLFRLVESLEKDDLDMYTSSFETRFDAKITWNRTKKSDLSYLEMLNRVMPTFSQVYPKEANEENREYFERLKEKLGLTLMVPAGSYIHTATNVIKRFTMSSYQENHNRISRDAGLVRGFGYRKMMLGRVFSKDIAEQRGLDRDLSVDDMLLAVENMAKDDNFRIPEFHIRAYDVIKEANHVIVTRFTTEVATYRIVKREGHYEDIRASYQKIKVPEIMKSRTRVFIYALVWKWDKMINPDVADSGRWLFVTYPKLLGDETLRSQLIYVDSICLTMNIKEPKMLDRHARLMVAMVSTSPFEAIVLVPEMEGDASSWDFSYKYISQYFSWGEELRLKTYIGKRRAEEVSHKVRKRVSLPDTARPLLLALWKIKSEGRNMGEISEGAFQLSSSGVIREIHIESLLKEHMRVEGYMSSSLWSSDLFTGILWYSLVNRLPGVSISRSSHKRKNGKNVKSFIFSFNDWMRVCVFTDNLGSDETTWSIVLEKDEKNRVMFPQEIDEMSYLLKIGTMLSYISSSRRSGINSINRIAKYDTRAEMEMIASRFGKTISVGVGLTEAWDNIAVYVIKGSIESFLLRVDAARPDSISIGDPDIVGSITESRVGEHLITPWKVRRDPTGLSVIYQGDLSSPLVNDRAEIVVQPKYKSISWYSETMETTINLQHEEAHWIIDRLAEGAKSHFSRDDISSNMLFLRRAELLHGLDIGIIYKFLYGNGMPFCVVGYQDNSVNISGYMSMADQREFKAHMLLEASEGILAETMRYNRLDEQARNLVRGVTITSIALKSMIRSVPNDITKYSYNDGKAGACRFALRFKWFVECDPEEVGAFKAFRGNNKSYRPAIDTFSFPKLKRMGVRKTYINNEDGTTQIWFATEQLRNRFPKIIKKKNKKLSTEYGWDTRIVGSINLVDLRDPEGLFMELIEARYDKIVRSRNGEGITQMYLGIMNTKAFNHQEITYNCILGKVRSAQINSRVLAALVNTVPTFASYAKSIETAEEVVHEVINKDPGKAERVAKPWGFLDNSIYLTIKNDLINLGVEGYVKYAFDKAGIAK
jgi:hypothetical protein